MKYRLLLFLSGIVILGGCQTQLSDYVPGMSDFNSSASMQSGSTNHNPAFKGPFSAITNVNYDSSFHGATTIAELKQIIRDQGDFQSGAYQIKGVITSLCNYGGFTKWQFYIQDCTGGIYFYVSGGVASLLSSSRGSNMICTVTAAQSYKGLIEVAAVSGVSITPAGAPSAIYVKDLQNLAGIDDGIIIRATGTVKEVKNDSSGVAVVYFNESIPPYYSVSGAFSPGDRVTMIGPLWMNGGVKMVDAYEAYPNNDASYAVKW